MAKRDDKTTAESATAAAAGPRVDSLEQRMVAFAEQLGRIVGTVQAKTEGWLDREALNAQISTIRDSASDLLAQLGGGMAKAAAESRATSGSGGKAAGSMGEDAVPTSPKAGSKRKRAATAAISTGGKVAVKLKASAASGAAGAKSGVKGRSGGAVDAPGKKHRKPMPSESGPTGAPRGEGSRVAKLRIRSEIRKPRG